MQSLSEPCMLSRDKFEPTNHLLSAPQWFHVMHVESIKVWINHANHLFSAPKWLHDMHVESRQIWRRVYLQSSYHKAICLQFSVTPCHACWIEKSLNQQCKSVAFWTSVTPWHACCTFTTMWHFYHKAICLQFKTFHRPMTTSTKNAITMRLGNFSTSAVTGKSALVAALLEMVAWGHLPATQAQRLAATAVKDGAKSVCELN